MSILPLSPNTNGNILAIDPGTTQFAFALFANRKFLSGAKVPNSAFFAGFQPAIVPDIVLIQAKSYGMLVGESVFEAIRYCGRFEQFILDTYPNAYIHYMPIQQVNLALCDDPFANDTTIKQRVLDLAGGKDKAIGCKNFPGIYYGVKKDIWQAIALGLTYIQQNSKQRFVVEPLRTTPKNELYFGSEKWGR